MAPKENSSIFFIDQTSEFDHHMVFNASVLKILLHIFNQDLSYNLGSMPRRGGIFITITQLYKNI